MEWRLAFQGDFNATFLQFLRRVKRKGHNTLKEARFELSAGEARQESRAGGMAIYNARVLVRLGTSKNARQPRK